jgi:hypothetical protein
MHVASILFLFLVQYLVVLFVKLVAIHMRQLDRFRADHFKLGPTFVTGDNVALFHFVHFKIQRRLTLWTIRHDGSSFSAPFKLYDDSIARCDSASFRERPACGQGQTGRNRTEI